VHTTSLQLAEPPRGPLIARSGSPDIIPAFVGFELVNMLGNRPQDVLVGFIHQHRQLVGIGSTNEQSLMLHVREFGPET
jgi:hypothetical protein